MASVALGKVGRFRLWAPFCALNLEEVVQVPLNSVTL